MLISLTKAEEIAEKHEDLLWNGWDLEVINPNVDGYYLKYGVFHNGKWSAKKTVRANSRGLYDIPRRFLETPKRRSTSK